MTAAAENAKAAFAHLVDQTLCTAHKDSFIFCNTALQTIHDDVSKLAERMVVVDMSKNRITSLPYSLAKFGLLSSLKLRGNMIENIPEGIFGTLATLNELDLTDNSLTSLPADLGTLPCLERLALTGNQLASLPASIVQLPNLRDLLVAENLLERLPEDIDRLRKLEKIEAAENRLTSLPASIVHCQSLRTLSVHNNIITVLPDKIWLLESLSVLHLYENPFDDSVVPPKLLVKRAKAILSYFLAISQGRTDDANEILEHSMNVPVKQKSVSRLGVGQIQRGLSTAEKPVLNREQSGYTPKPPVSPRNESVATEIPSGIVNRASMSLRKASAIIDSQSEKAQITARPRPSKPTVLSRAPSQVTDSDKLVNTPTSRARPQSVAPRVLGDRSDSASSINSGNSAISQSPKTSTPKITPKPNAASATGSPNVPSRQVAKSTASLMAPITKPSPASITTPNDSSKQQPTDNSLSTPPNATDIPVSIQNVVSPEAFNISTDMNGHQQTPHVKTAVEAVIDSPFDDANSANGIDPALATVAPDSSSLETSFDLVGPISSPVASPAIPDDVFAPIENVETSQNLSISREPSSTPRHSVGSLTARLTIEDAKPLIMRENSVPIPDAEAEFVFDDGPIEKQPPTVDTPSLPSKKPSKRIKQPAEVISTGVAPQSNQVAIRGRAKTRKILGANSSIGTPFYGASDMVTLPRKILEVPLMRVQSKRFVLPSANTEPPTWKEMFSPQNLQLIPSGTYAGYAEHFQEEDHINFVGEDKIEGGFVIVSLLKKATSETDINCVIRTKDGDFAILVPIPDKKPKDGKGWLSLLRKNPDFAAAVNKKTKLQQVINSSFIEEAAELESKLDRTTYKIGVVYCKEGQTEEEDFLSNTEGSAEFNDFLDWLGDRIKLKGWSKFDGGLDTQKNGTGTHSVFTELENLQLMFHVSTLLPSDGSPEEWIQEKKVHIGNDIVVLVFMEGETAQTIFNPRKFVSHFNHAFIVINPVRQKGLTLYRMNTIYKSEVTPSTPSIPPDSIFERSDLFRKLLLTILINSERSACMSELFASSLSSLRYHNLYTLGQKHYKSGSGCMAGCAGKR